MIKNLNDFHCRPGADAILAISFAQYVTSPLFPDSKAPEFAIKLIAAAVIIFFTWLNCYSVQWATKVQNAFMFGKIVALVLIIITGVVNLCMGKRTKLTISVSKI